MPEADAAGGRSSGAAAAAAAAAAERSCCLLVHESDELAAKGSTGCFGHALGTWEAHFWLGTLSAKCGPAITWRLDIMAKFIDAQLSASISATGCTVPEGKYAFAAAIPSGSPQAGDTTSHSLPGACPRAVLHATSPNGCSFTRPAHARPVVLLQRRRCCRLGGPRALCGHGRPAQRRLPAGGSWLSAVCGPSAVASTPCRPGVRPYL